jgi:transglutaminase-like putative cysteine protease
VRRSPSTRAAHAFPDPAEALGATELIEADDARIVELAACLTGEAEGEGAVRILFDWVRDEIKYDMAPEMSGREIWRATNTLENGYGFCQQKAVLLASLLRAKGIPAGIIVQDILDHKIPPHYVAFIGHQRLEAHGLVCAHLDGRWVQLDPTLPRSLCEKKRYRLVEWDGVGDATLPATDLDGEPHFDIVEELGVWPDMPDSIVDFTLNLEYLSRPEYKKMARRHGPGM